MVVRTLVLRLVEPAFHGRVMGTLMLTWGANIVGTLAGGGLAEGFGVGPVIVGSGVLIIARTGCGCAAPAIGGSRLGWRACSVG